MTKLAQTTHAHIQTHTNTTVETHGHHRVPQIAALRRFTETSVWAQPLLESERGTYGVPRVFGLRVFGLGVTYAACTAPDSVSNKMLRTNTVRSSFTSASGHHTHTHTHHKVSEDTLHHTITPQFCHIHALVDCDVNLPWQHGTARECRPIYQIRGHVTTATTHTYS